MKKFKVYGEEVRKSHGIGFVYRYSDCIEACDVETATTLFIEKHKAPRGRRWTAKVYDVKEVYNNVHL